MGFQRANEFAKKNVGVTKSITNSGTKRTKPTSKLAKTNKDTVACPDCAGRLLDPSCVRCEGTGVVCARCKGVGYVYRQLSDGRAVAIECTCDKIALRRTQVLWPFLENYSSLRGELLNKTFANFSRRPGLSKLPQAFEAAQKFAAHPKGWVFLQGPPGIGKTHIAAAIANALIARRQPVLFLNVPELLAFLRAGFQANLRSNRDPDFETRLQTIKSFPVLILDDWGAHSDTPWADEQLYLILNFRTERVLPTVVTSNIEKVEDLEPRIFSRLMNHRIGQAIQFPEDTPDYRLAD